MKKLVSLLLALCMMCSAMVAVAEQATQEVDGWVKYQVPAGLVEKNRVELYHVEQVFLECDQYQLTITTMDVAGVMYQIYSHWDERYLDEYVYYQYPREIAAMYLMLGSIIMQSGGLGMQHALEADKLDAGMVDGQPIMAYHCPLYVLYSHYSDDKNGIGFVVEVRPQQGAAMTEAEMMQIAEAVCLSYQGLTEQYYDDNLEVVVTDDRAIIVYEEPKWPGWDDYAYKVAEMNESFTVYGEYGAWYMTTEGWYIPKSYVSVANLDGSNDMQSPASEAVAGEQTAEESAAQRVVITADSGKIRTEASISGGLIKTAYKGETYELIEKSGDWYVVKVDGRTGYLHSGVAKIQ